MNKPSESDLQVLNQSYNMFAMDLLKQVGDIEKNLIFSPFSIIMVLSALWIGAKNLTAEEMASVLHLSLSSDALSRAASIIIETTRADGAKRNNQLYVANALWLEEGHPIVPEYRKMMRRDFKSDLYDVKFSPAEAICKEINAWVSRQTRGKILQLMSPSGIPADSGLVITNAIYFLGEWLTVFPAHTTKDLPFYQLNGQETNVPTMYVKATFNYAENPEVQYLELPYVGEFLAMGIFLPKQRAGLPAVIDKVSAEQLSIIVKDASRETVRVFLPRFKLDTRFELARTLQEMGIKTAFQAGQADFSGITNDPKGLYISEVIHKAFVDVNEKGTEAAAATAITLGIGSALRPEAREPPTFRADHPFLFLIRHTRLNVILFLGQVVFPRK